MKLLKSVFRKGTCALVAGILLLSLTGCEQRQPFEDQTPAQPPQQPDPQQPLTPP